MNVCQCKCKICHVYFSNHAIVMKSFYIYEKYLIHLNKLLCYWLLTQKKKGFTNHKFILEY